MGKSALGKSFVVEGVSGSEALGLLKSMLLSSHGGKQIPDAGQYTAIHLRIPVAKDTTADVIVFSTDKIFVSASPNFGQSNFDSLAKEVEEVAGRCAKPLGKAKPLEKLRAEELLGYALGLDLEQDKERMVAVIIADTADEIVLTAKMKSLKIAGEALKAGIPDKIKYIRDKKEGVYMESEIKQIRDLRNGIAHSGNIPTHKEAKQVLEWAQEFVGKY
jgi:hypothetical protein